LVSDVGVRLGVRVGVRVGVGVGAAEEEGIDLLDCADSSVLDLSATFSFSRPSNFDALPFRIEKNC
jgi:hypothetical protein